MRLDTLFEKYLETQQLLSFLEAIEGSSANPGEKHIAALEAASVGPEKPTPSTDSHKT